MRFGKRMFLPGLQTPGTGERQIACESIESIQNEPQSPGSGFRSQQRSKGNDWETRERQSCSDILIGLHNDLGERLVPRWR